MDDLNKSAKEQARESAIYFLGCSTVHDRNDVSLKSLLESHGEGYAPFLNNYFKLNIKKAYIGSLSREFAGFRKNRVNVDFLTEYRGKLLIHTEFETKRDQYVIARDAIHGLEVIAKYLDHDVLSIILYFPPKKNSKTKKDLSIRNLNQNFMPVELFLADLDGIKILDEIYKKHIEDVKLTSCDYLALSLLFTLTDQFDSHESFNDLFTKTVDILSNITDRKLCEIFSHNIYFMSATYFNSYLLNNLDRGGKMGRVTFDLHQMFNQSKLEVEARAKKAEAGQKKAEAGQKKAEAGQKKAEDKANKAEIRAKKADARVKALEIKYKELVQQYKALIKPNIDLSR